MDKSAYGGVDWREALQVGVLVDPVMCLSEGHARKAPCDEACLEDEP